MSLSEASGPESLYPPTSSEWVLAANPDLDNFVRGIRYLREMNGGYFPITAPHTARLFADKGLAPGMAAVKAFATIRALEEAGILICLPEKTKTGPDYYPTWDFPANIPSLEAS